MRKNIVGVIGLLLVLALTPVRGNDTSTGIGITIDVEDFAPRIWLDDNTRVVIEDCGEEGRVSDCRERLVERHNNYAFEGEQLFWEVLVMDKNGIEKIEDVHVTVGTSPETEEPIEANCDLDHIVGEREDLWRFNAWIDEERILEGDPDTMAVFDCKFTVETPNSMYGEHWIQVEVCDLTGLCAIFDESEYWFLNPVLALELSDSVLDFQEVRPGTYAYATPLTVMNAADEGSGVTLDMFISGTDFYDPDSSGAKCPDTNQLALTNINYYATSGAYSTSGDARSDIEGYVPIPYEQTGVGAPPNNGRMEIIQNFLLPGGYSSGNLLTPGAEIAMTFRLWTPEPCNGDFSDGDIFFHGEAI